MTVDIVMTVWNIKTAHRRNLLGIVITMLTVVTSPTIRTKSDRSLGTETYVYT